MTTINNNRKEVIVMSKRILKKPAKKVVNAEQITLYAKEGGNNKC